MGRLVVAASLAGAGGCIAEIDHEPEPTHGSVLRRCELVPPEPIQSQGTPLSLRIGDETRLLFGETWLKHADADGRKLRDNTLATVTDVDALCDGELSYVLEADAPRQVVAHDAAEQAINEAGDDRVVLWPVGAFSRGDDAIVYYDKVLLHGGDYFDSTRIGTGICTLRADGTCARATTDAPDEPSMLWPYPLPTWGHGAFVAEDGLAYLYSCDRVGDFDNRCRTARVAPDDATDIDAYEYLRFDGSWSSDPRDAVNNLRDQTSMAVAWNGALGRYTTFAARLLDEEIEVRIADDPAGPWSDSHVLFEAPRPTSWFVGSVNVHTALQTDPSNAVLTFHSNTQGGSGDHLVVVRLDDNLKEATP